MNWTFDMEWTKHGLIFVPDGQQVWNLSHAAVPTVDILDHCWRIYYASRDRDNRSYTSFIDVEIGNPKKVLYIHEQPILPLGKLGTFDDSGVMPSWVTSVGALKYLFYTGWTTRATIPYQNSIGLAVSRDGGLTFERYADGPLFGNTLAEPYFTGTSCVLVEDGLWRNWYLSCTKWEVINGRPEPFYHLKYADSPDGIHWNRRAQVAIDYQSEAEAGIARASVIRKRNGYCMWFCYRSAYDYRTKRENGYRIGYAESPDGVHWNRRNNISGIDVSPEGWDSQMIAYPHVIKHEDQLFMFYNGNGFGKSGFGYATAAYYDK